MRKFAKSVFAFMLAGVLVFVIVACGRKITQSNFEKIQVGMPQEEAQKILGQPTESSSINVGTFSGTASTWKTKSCTISIQFLNGKVQAKQFIKAKE